MARSNALLGRSLDPHATMLSALEVVIPSLADWGVLHLTGDVGEDRRQVLHADEQRLELLERLTRFPFARGQPTSRTRSPDSGPRILEGMSEVLLAGLGTPDELVILRELQPHSVAILPLFAGAHGCGALTLVTAESGRQFAREDLPLLGVLADQIGLALHASRILDRTERDRCQVEARLSALAHDLKNHLHAITIAASLLGADDMPPDRRRDQLATIERAIRLINERLSGEPKPPSTRA